MFFRKNKESRFLCNRRLRRLFDLHCIDRFFPPIDVGSTPQHVVLDRAGAKILGVESSFNKIPCLPLTHKHMILMTQFLIRANRWGFGWGEREYQMGSVVGDIYYSKYRMMVEIDSGNHGSKVLQEKARNYADLPNVDWIVFVTSGSESRVESFLDSCIFPGRKGGCVIKDLDTFFSGLRKKIKIV